MFVPVKILGDNGQELCFAAVSCGYDFSMILSTCGLVYGAGSNFHGELGIEEGIRSDPNTLKTQFTRAKIDSVFQIATGWAHTLLLTRYGLLACGQSRDNPLGLSSLIEKDDLTYFMQVPIPGLLEY